MTHSGPWVIIMLDEWVKANSEDKAASPGDS